MQESTKIGKANLPTYFFKKSVHYPPIAARSMYTLACKYVLFKGTILMWAGDMQYISTLFLPWTKTTENVFLLSSIIMDISWLTNILSNSIKDCGCCTLLLKTVKCLQNCLIHTLWELFFLDATKCLHWINLTFL